jgi:type 1 glutamine amidotransferase
MKVTLQFEDGSSKVVQLYAGQEFVDYIRRIDVAGSIHADGIVSDHQIRTFAVPVGSPKSLAKIILESEGNNVAATTAAITAETSDSGLVLQAVPPASGVPAPLSPLLKELDPNNPQTTAATGQKFAEPKAAGTLRVLLAGAGSSHDFPKFFLGADSVMLRGKAKVDIAATPNLEEALALLPQADVLVFSGNHPQYGSDAFQKALNAFADAGKGVIILHAGTWKNYPPKTGFNQRFVGGGATSHGFSDFTVTVKQPNHPVMAKVPATFTITDESYHADVPAGPGVEILAQNGLGKGTDKIFPSVWIVKDTRARIVCITLGHAAAAHDNPAYQTLMTNAVNWVGRR